MSGVDTALPPEAKKRKVVEDDSTDSDDDAEDDSDDESDAGPTRSEHFFDEDGDVEILSSDNVLFKVKSYHLQAGS